MANTPKAEDEYTLDYCAVCCQMTNHGCLKHRSLKEKREQVAHLKLPVTYNSLDIGFNEAIEKVLGVFDGN